MRKFRKLITTSVGFSFVVVGVTGVIFKLRFKNHALEEIHGWLGLAMVIAATFHIVQNWGSFTRHLRDRRLYALLVPIALVVAFFALSAEPKGGGVNPRRVVHKLVEGHVGDVAKALGKDVSAVCAAMKRDGIEASSTDTLQQLADHSGKPAEKILEYFAL